MSLDSEPPSKVRKICEGSVQESSLASSGDDSFQLPPNCSLSDFEKRIVALAKQFPKGVPNKIVQTDSPEISVQERAAAINNLLELGIFELYKQGTELIYKLKTESSQTQMKDADEEEKVVYEIIGAAGNKGIWIRDIRFKSNLTMPQLNKILKGLETKRLIKAVKSVAAAKKKVYMLFDLEPDRSLTGGAWYSDQDFELEFVTILNQQCLRYMQDKLSNSRLKRAQVGPLAARVMASSTLEEIWNFIKNLGISKVDLSLDDIESILNTLVYDDAIDKIIKGTNITYIARDSFGSFTTYDAFPCGICPVAAECSDSGPVNPRACVYMKKWLENDIFDF